MLLVDRISKLEGVEVMVPDISYMLLPRGIELPEPDDDFGYKIVKSKIEAFEIPIKPIEAWIILSAVGCNTPGKAILGLIQILESEPDESKDTLDEYMNAFTKGRYTDKSWDIIISNVEEMRKDVPNLSFY